MEKAEAGATGSPGIADEIFITKFAFDVINRQTYVETQGPDGDIAAPADSQISRTAYNSRGLATHFRDALDNTRLQTYEGAGRLTKTEEHLRVDGTGATVLDATQSGDGIITTTQTWDGNSRRLSLKDDNNNTTTFGYDALDRQNRLTFADGRSRQRTIDRDSNVTRYTDENGSVSDRTYEALNRLKDDTITRATGVIGTTLQTFQYDGAGRNTRATDNGDPADAAQASVETFVFDSLGRQLEESLQIGSTGTVRYTTGSKWSSDSDRTELTYPNGRQVQPTFDELGRLKTLKDGGATSPIATWRCMGARLLEMAYGNSSCLTHLNDARTRSASQPGYPSEIRGYDGVERVTAHRWLECTRDANGFVTAYVNPGTPLIGFRHAWNVADSKLSQELMHATSDSEGYKYDSAYRVIKFERGTLNAALTEIVTLTATPGLLQRQTWTLDGPGNWPTNVTTTGGTPTTETRTHNNLNQIAAIGATPLAYDSNGNLTDDGTYTFAWDAKNRLRKSTRKSRSVVVGTYSYGAVGRRIRRIYIVGADPAKTVHYYLDGQRVIEEREVEGAPPAEVFKRQYTYGPYVDECLTLDRDLNGNGIATDPGERLFYHANTLYSVYALSDANRVQPERYLYHAYGIPVLWLPGADGVYGTADDVFAVGGASTIHNVRCFTGRECDVEAMLNYFRARYQFGRFGRFAGRDPLSDLMGRTPVGPGYARVLADDYTYGEAGAWGASSYSEPPIRQYVKLISNQLSAGHYERGTAILSLADGDWRLLDVLNLYSYVLNAPTRGVDPWGLWELRCRRLAGLGTVTCQRHCWVECNGHSYSLLNNDGTGSPEVDDPRDKGKGTVVASGDDQCDCIEANFYGEYINYPYDKDDCNSNWFANQLLQCCGIKAKRPSGAWGWNDCKRRTFDCCAEPDKPPPKPKKK